MATNKPSFLKYDFIRPSVDISKLPNHHKYLLDAITLIYDKFKDDKDIKFYVTGGAAAAYLLPEEGLPINDIDCVCIINTDLTPEVYRAKQKGAVQEVINITRDVLDKVTIPDLGGEILQTENALPGRPYMISHTVPSNYGLTTSRHRKLDDKTPNLIATSPFTGFVKVSDELGILVVSISQRTPENPKLMDITFPLLTYDKDNYRVKWKANTQLVEVLGHIVPVLTPESLRMNQRYAAKHTPPTNTTGAKERRMERVALLEKTFGLLPVIQFNFSEKSGRLPPLVRRADGPVAAATENAGKASSGGGGAAGAATGGAAAVTSPPPPQLSIYEFKGKVFLTDNRIKRFWPAQGYDPDTGIYSFITGFRGPIGNYWLYPDNFYRMSPPGM